MNRIKTISALLLSALLWTGCSDDKDVDRAEIRPLSLTAEQQEVVITRENAAQTALTYTWSDASRYAGEAAYTLEINLRDAPEAKARKSKASRRTAVRSRAKSSSSSAPGHGAHSPASR